MDFSFLSSLTSTVIYFPSSLFRFSFRPSYFLILAHKRPSLLFLPHSPVDFLLPPCSLSLSLLRILLSPHCVPPPQVLEEQRMNFQQFIRKRQDALDIQCSAVSDWATLMSTELRRRDEDLHRFLSEDLHYNTGRNKHCTNIIRLAICVSGRKSRLRRNSKTTGTTTKVSELL